MYKVGKTCAVVARTCPVNASSLGCLVRVEACPRVNMRYGEKASMRGDLGECYIVEDDEEGS